MISRHAGIDCLPRVIVLFVLTCCAFLPARGEEKYVLLDDVPNRYGHLEVAPDGSRVYLAGNGKFYVNDAAGKVLEHYGAALNGNPGDLCPITAGELKGWFIANESGFNPHIALIRPDGTEARVLVPAGNKKETVYTGLGRRMPVALAIDETRGWFFVVDHWSRDGRDADLAMSRIAVFDLNGKFVKELARYDDTGKDAPARYNTWYRDIEVDPVRQRIFATAWKTNELVQFDYNGVELKRAKGTGGVAVFPDGRVAVINPGSNDILIYNADLAPVATLRNEVNLSTGSGPQDLEADAAGRLYAATGDPTVTFLRWEADLARQESIRPHFRKLVVTYPKEALLAGAATSLAVSVTGNPTPPVDSPWQVLARPSDGSTLRWQPLAAAYRDGTLQVAVPADLRGLYELVVRHGCGPINWTERSNDLYTQRTVAIMPAGAEASVAAFTDSGRHAFVQGEAIPLRVTTRMDPRMAVPVTLVLLREQAVLHTATVTVNGSYTTQIPGAVTARLLPGHYLLRPTTAGCESYAWAIDIATAVKDSPLQRILYHEFGRTPAMGTPDMLADMSERISFVRNYLDEVAREGFTRETDRLGKDISDAATPSAWLRSDLPVSLNSPAFPPGEAIGVPRAGLWAPEVYLDQATAHGVRYDAQLIGHCGSGVLAEVTMGKRIPTLQMMAQWLGRYPAFYGFNYNDEMSFARGERGLDGLWTPDDNTIFNKLVADNGNNRGKAIQQAHGMMYTRFNAAVRQVDPALNITTAPMWQSNAADSHYPPAVYPGMTETYSHFMSEGYSFPFYPAHSVQYIRRPGIPMMGVFDNGHGCEFGDLYQVGAMQVAGRGVQGVGFQHYTPLGDAYLDPRGSSAYRTTNQLLKMYGTVFAEAAPLNEGAVLYSSTQDYTERRNSYGTPQWERVYDLYASGLLAGLPLHIAFEEDVQQGWLLLNGKPRVPMLFLVGCTVKLPADVNTAIAGFVAVGGKLFIDADSADFPGATRLPINFWELKDPFKFAHAADSMWPYFQPVLERHAAQLKAAVGNFRRFPIDSSDLWVAPNQFDGGGIRYLMFASESSPFPWRKNGSADEDAMTLWSLGTFYKWNAFTWLPKAVTASFPADRLKPGAVIYDVFAQQVVKPVINDGKATIPVDVRTLPGRLFALAPAALGVPKMTAMVSGDRLTLAVIAADGAGKALAARVPLRIRLVKGDQVAVEVYRGTGNDGKLQERLTLPAEAGPWTVEVTELLGGHGTACAVQPPATPANWLQARGASEVLRDAQLRTLLSLAKAKGLILLAPAGKEVALPAEKLKALAASLDMRGITLSPETAAPAGISPGIYLCTGTLQGRQKTLGPLLASAWQKGMLPYPCSETVPGPGRGFATALFSPRGMDEHAIALVGGDADGLAAAADALLAFLKDMDKPATSQQLAKAATVAGKPAQVPHIPTVQAMTGPVLDGVQASPDGKHLLVTAQGYHRNLALVSADGAAPRVVRAARVGQAPTVQSAFLTPDGKTFGASSRTVARHGEEFDVIDAQTGARMAFAAFGDLPYFGKHGFAINDTADTVLVTGAYGVACYHKQNGVWKEAWANEYWKQFDKLEWPVANDREHTPHFSACIPQGADYALVLFREVEPEEWLATNNFTRGSLSAVDLATGRERWRFDIPIENELLIPHLLTSDDGYRILLQVQVSGWGKEHPQFYSLDSQTGRQLGSWSATAMPIAVAVNSRTGLLAISYPNSLLEVRREDATLVMSRLWDTQPVSMAFSDDGSGLYVADSGERVTALALPRDEGEETTRWRVDAGTTSHLLAQGDRLYAAGWDGRLRAFSADGESVWTLDLTSALVAGDPVTALAASTTPEQSTLIEMKRPATAGTAVPASANLLANGGAKVTVGGIGGWMSEGAVQVTAEQLTNGKLDDVTTPWLSLDELFWSMSGRRPVWVQIEFPQPTAVSSLTVYENSKKPEAWPTEGLVQVWNEGQQRWDTAAFGAFLQGPVNTYTLSLKGVTKLRYLPWSSYCRNFYTCEIEVR